MSRKIAPSEREAPEIAQWLPGQHEGSDSQELGSALVRLATARVLQEALEHEPTASLGRDRYARRAAPCGYRKGYAAGPVKPAEGGLRLQGPQGRGLREPYRSQLWGAL